MIYILRRREKRSFHAAVNLIRERKKIYTALKFRAGVNFTSDTCKHPLTDQISLLDCLYFLG